MEKVFAWMRKPARPLPENARISQIRYFFPDLPEHPLLIWQISWLEEGEKHLFLLFEPPEQRRAARRAQLWAVERCESLEQFQILRRLERVEYQESRFDPREGDALFAC